MKASPTFLLLTFAVISGCESPDLRVTIAGPQMTEADVHQFNGHIEYSCWDLEYRMRGEGNEDQTVRWIDATIRFYSLLDGRELAVQHHNSFQFREWWGSGEIKDGDTLNAVLGTAATEPHRTVTEYTYRLAGGPTFAEPDEVRMITFSHSCAAP